MIQIEVRLQSQIDRPCSALAYGVFEGKQFSAQEHGGLGEEAAGVIKRLFSEKIFSGKPGQIFSFLLSSEGPAKIVVLLGLGPEKKFSLTSLREAAAPLTGEFKRLHSKRPAVFLPSLVQKKFSIQDIARTVTESFLLSAYQFKGFHSSPKNGRSEENTLDRIDLMVSSESEKNRAEAGRMLGEVVATSVNFARDLGHSPANLMTPEVLAAEAKKMAKECGLKCTLLEEKEIRKLKMGGLLAVAQGSPHMPYLVILEHKGARAKKKICLVGKGITFDTGGISLKPAKDMEKMKYDMMGAASVFAALRSAALLDLPLHVIGIAPLCENLPGANPIKPGDVITARNGKSVEVINTDAEGRLVLMEALSYSEIFQPDFIIDIATLTGACAATFADQCMGLMSNNQTLAEKIVRAGTRSGERAWQLPMWGDYLGMLKSEVADLKNVGAGYAGTIVAAKFLEQFVPKDTPWAHLDIAGVAWADSPKPFTPKGPTGVGIRLLVELLKDWK